MRFASKCLSLALIGLLLCSCNRWTGPAEPPPATPTLEVASPEAITPEVYADAFFTGCAYVDANGNGEIDAEDGELEGATLIVFLSIGAEFRARTAGYCATTVVPGGLGEDAWPVTLRMEPPEDTGYESLSPAEVVLEYPEGRANFLFAAPQDVPQSPN